MRTSGTVVLLMVLSSGVVPGHAGSGPQGSQPSFAELLTLAKHDMGSEDGAAYDMRMAQQFASKHGETVQKCVEASGNSTPEPFRVVVVVAKDGKVDKISLSAETGVAKCIGKALLKEVFPKPPFAPFHDLIEMSFK